ncbi:Arc family DNA-binding protein [Pararhizobium sp. YC-54]|uniref:Arc family DNA-binding protein n=1 Tax=Pararhizobium sp. YC-54 TaxID=2986920 RepID=UPI0021F79A69|nr:Arc family DNA-binding protein [Pararhizobium sp. YC-54]MCV9997358.1 Arc family DNA-binding protein [Pararhizobium sp. YC-54]
MAREDLHFRLRIPGDLKAKIERAAEINGTSMTAEMVDRLEKSFDVAVPIPTHLAERIKLYADRQHRSLVDEVLRLLEREYPAQWELVDRMEHLANLLAALTSAKADGPINRFVTDVQDTVQGIVSGRVKGVDPEIRDEVSSLWAQYQERLSQIEYENEQEINQLDEEEERMRRLAGSTEKLAEPLPPEPNPLSDKIFLSNVLPARVLADLVESIRQGDMDAAADVVRRMPKEQIAQRVRFEQLPLEAQYRLRHEEPPTNGDDPFGFTKET